jgi:hypothetical protein
VNEKLNRDSQPQGEPRGGGGGEAFPKKKFKTGNKKRLRIQPSKIIKKSWAQKLFLHP